MRVRVFTLLRGRAAPAGARTLLCSPPKLASEPRPSLFTRARNRLIKALVSRRPELCYRATSSTAGVHSPLVNAAVAQLCSSGARGSPAGLGW